MDWENYVEIAQALDKLYPDTSPIGMSQSELIEKVSALSGFAGGQYSESYCGHLASIMHNWIKIHSKRDPSILNPPPLKTYNEIMKERQYRLEITMESRAGDKHKYIKRSFPAEKGTLDISKYGYPCTLFRTVEIGNRIGGEDSCYLEIRFDGKGFPVYQNSFHTEKREFHNAHIDPYLKRPVSEGVEVVHTTFYLYVE
jgi:Fe-S-cluster formation regulator IscX/YfhJ